MVPLLKIYTLNIFLFFLVPQIARSQEDNLCEPKSIIETLLSYVQDIEDKCLEDIQKKNKDAVREELKLLVASIQEVDEELPKVAVKIEGNQIKCAPSPGKTIDPMKVKRCQDLISWRNRMARRIDFLMGWNSNSETQVKPTVQKMKSLSPCPNTDDLNDMQATTGFNPKLRQLWIACRLRNDIGE